MFHLLPRSRYKHALRLNGGFSPEPPDGGSGRGERWNGGSPPRTLDGGRLINRFRTAAARSFFNQVPPSSHARTHLYLYIIYNKYCASSQHFCSAGRTKKYLFSRARGERNILVIERTACARPGVPTRKNRKTKIESHDGRGSSRKTALSTLTVCLFFFEFSLFRERGRATRIPVFGGV